MPVHRVASILASLELFVELRTTWIFVLFFMLAGPASAYVGTPYLTPLQPSPNDAISVNVYSDECDVVDVGIPWPPPVSRQGNKITILFTGIHEGDPEFCYFGAGVSSYPVGTYPQGSYTLDVERRYMSFSGTWIQETLNIIPFTIVGQPPQEPVTAPALDDAGAGILLLALASLAVWSLYSRRVECFRVDGARQFFHRTVSETSVRTESEIS
jgi:hypothetical protein